jgi:hypothetical protein
MFPHGSIYAKFIVAMPEMWSPLRYQGSLALVWQIQIGGSFQGEIPKRPKNF